MNHQDKGTTNNTNRTNSSEDGSDVFAHIRWIRVIRGSPSYRAQAGDTTWPLAARARALTCSTRRKPSESAWLNSPIASIEALLSEYIWCGTSVAAAKYTCPLYRFSA